MSETKRLEIGTAYTSTRGNHYDVKIDAIIDSLLDKGGWPYKLHCKIDDFNSETDLEIHEKLVVVARMAYKQGEVDGQPAGAIKR